uniref:Uncharacterized protein n=1 Tax=Janibacter limosus TaxID=53458 RepID=A0AC61U320_9MICO|nr:hypothetical protein [Janibacter limosus]
MSQPSVSAGGRPNRDLHCRISLRSCALVHISLRSCTPGSHLLKVVRTPAASP